MAATPPSASFVVPRADQYTVEGLGTFFCFSLGNVNYRDVSTKLDTLTKPVLQRLAKRVGVKGYSKLRKADLLAAVQPCVIFE